MSEKIDLLVKYIDDFYAYSYDLLKIKTKTGSIEPFKWNNAQKYIDEKLEKQLREKGFVRAIILKGRQQGCSTYVEARFYHKTSMHEGRDAFILSHAADSTTHLFDITKRYHDNMLPLVQTPIKKSNAKELIFEDISSQFKIGTAGSKATGRSTTIHYFHGSEVAWWENAEGHMAGVMQAVPSGEFMEGTEIIQESTANGIGNPFHSTWQDAEAGIGDYIAIFVPWFWQQEYRSPLPKDYIVVDIDYQETYSLTDEQIRWRELKIIEFKGDEGKFNQEYPATAVMAFDMSTDDTFLDANDIARARKLHMVDEGINRLVIGVDPARFGDDRTALVWRRGRMVTHYKTYSKIDTMDTADLVARELKGDPEAYAHIDVCGLGAGVFDRLHQLGYTDRVVAVNAAESSIEEAYANMRAYMWGMMRDWLKESPAVSIPDEDELHSDLLAVKYKYDAKGRILLEKKEDIKKRGLRSPDIGDALALTFAMPYADNFSSAIDYGDESWIR